jgi:hypothetical protein
MITKQLIVDDIGPSRDGQRSERYSADTCVLWMHILPALPELFKDMIGIIESVVGYKEATYMEELSTDVEASLARGGGSRPLSLSSNV